MPPKRKLQDTVAAAADTAAAPAAAEAAAAPAAKRQRVAGAVALTFGQNCMGQLGVGLDTSERKKPTLLKGVLEGEDVALAVSGGMHCAVATVAGKVYTWGCNDQNALGRKASDDESAIPGPAQGLDGVHVVALSAGDSHTAALSADGRVFATGCFRDSNGILGFTEEMEEQVAFVQVYPPGGAAPSAASPRATHLASGADHVAFLTAHASPRQQLWTFGCPAQGQLGRVSERFTERDAHRDAKPTPAAVAKRRATVASLVRFLRPHAVDAKLFKRPLVALYCGSWATLVVDAAGAVFGTGLNNFSQLGLASAGTVLYEFHAATHWAAVAAQHGGIAGLACSQHHALALAGDGAVFAVGRGSEGQLGVPRAAFVDGKEEVASPTVVPALAGKKVVAVSTGSTVSYAVTADGKAYAWGFGENLQLGNGEDEDQYEPIEVTGKQLEDKDVVMIDAGGQHSVMVAAPKKA